MSDEMTRDDLLTLLRAWGWTLCGTGNRGAYERWQKGVHIVRLPLFDDQDTTEWLEGAQHEFAKAEGPRLLRVVLEVQTVHAQYFSTDVPPDHEDAGCEPEDVWRFDRDFRAALAPLPQTTDERTDR